MSFKLKKDEDRRRGVCIVEGCNREVEDFEELGQSMYCHRHNDILIDQANEAREWRYFHED